MWIANLSAGGLILLIGLLMRVFKLSGLIAGYNTMPEEEKEKYDEERLIKTVANMLIIAAAVLFLAWFLSLITDIPDTTLIFSSWGLFLLIVIGGVIYANTGNRFKEK